MVATGKKDKLGEQMFAFVDGKFYKESDAMTLAKKYGYNKIQRVYETYNSLGWTSFFSSWPHFMWGFFYA